MKLNLGEKTDSNPIDSPLGSWLKGNNIVISKIKDAIINEGGFDFIKEFNFTIVGVIKTNKLNEILLCTLVDGISEIGIFDFNSGDYITKIKDSRFNFQLDKQVVGEITIIANELNIILNDSYNTPKLINIDTIPVSLNPDKTLTNSDEFKLLNLFTYANPTNYELVSVNSFGGSLKSGVYYVSAAYELQDGTITDCINISNPISIVDGKIIDDIYDGCEPNTPTTKSITIKILNPDIAYKYIYFILIQKIDGQLSVIKLGKQAVTDNLIYTITGNEDFTQISIEEVLIKKNQYRTVESITQLQESLFLGGVTEFEQVNYQKYANDIVVKWVGEETVGVNANKKSYKDEAIIFNKKGFLADEVYAIYINLLFSNGNKGKAYHIPGRIALTGDTDIETDTKIVEAFDGKAKKFHINNTALIDGTMGYWENENEIYPDTPEFELIKGQNVRHHKFPSIKQYVSWGNVYYDSSSDVIEDGAGEAAIFGIKLSNIVIPEELKDIVIGYEISYAKRTLDNQTIIGQSFLLPITPETTVHINNGSGGRGHQCRFHDFNLLKYKPELVPTHYTNQLLLGCTDTTNALTSFDYPIWNNIEAADTYFREIQKIKYIPHNNGSDADYNNSQREEFIYSELKYQLLGEADRRWLSNLCVFKLDIYKSFYSQELVSTGKVFFTTADTVYETGNLYGGDIFATPYEYRVIDIASDSPGRIYMLLVQSTSNIAYRHQGIEWYETYRPKSYLPNPAAHGGVPYSTYNSIPEYRGYNGDYSSVNDLNIAIISNPFEKIQYTNQNLIAKSQKNNNISSTVGWRTFLTTDIYETIKNKGRIVVLKAFNNYLLIQLEKALLKTITTDRLKTTALEVALGTGNIFDREPDEVLFDEDGYIGCQNKYAPIICKLGYVVPDSQQGKIFIFDGSVKEISNSGKRNFFRDNLYVAGDNPLTGNGITLTYDEENNRLLLTKVDRDGEEFEFSFTLSYSPEIEGWVSSHNYIPNNYLAIRGSLYSFKNNKLYKHNSKKVKGKYYNDTIYPSYIISAFAPQKDKDKVLINIQWITDVFKSTEDSIILPNNTFTSIACWNSYQCTGETTLKVLTDIQDLDSNIRATGRTWKFNKIRDLVKNSELSFVDKNTYIIDDTNIDINKDFTLKKSLIDKYVIVKFSFDNSIIFNNLHSEICIYDIDINFGLV